MASQGDPSEYDRGVTAGAIETRLAGHDKHFAAINGSLAKIPPALHALEMSIQGLADQMRADAAKVVATAAALKEAEEVRRNTADQRWSPWQKGLALIGGIVAVLVVVAYIRGWN